jgi:hypothetical protein
LRSWSQVCWMSLSTSALPGTTVKNARRMKRFNQLPPGVQTSIPAYFTSQGWADSDSLWVGSRRWRRHRGRGQGAHPAQHRTQIGRYHRGSSINNVLNTQTRTSSELRVTWS